MSADATAIIKSLITNTEKWIFKGERSMAGNQFVKYDFQLLSCTFTNFNVYIVDKLIEELKKFLFV